MMLLSSSCGIPLTEDLGVYLGVPILHKRASKEVYVKIIEKVRSRLSNWKQKVLSRAGRRSLVQSVINAIPVYTMQTTLLPATVFDQLDRLLARNFVWGGSETYAHNHLVHWERVSLPRRYGGLGIRKAREANIALLSKLGWAIESNKDSMTCSVLRHKYLAEQSLHEVVPRQGTSSTWKGILKCRALLRKGQKWLIGNGTRVQLWTNWWVGEGPLDTVSIGDLATTASWTV